MVDLELWNFFRYTFGDSISFLIDLRLDIDELLLFWVVSKKIGRAILILYERNLKNYVSQSYMYLKDFSYFSSFL